ncbi:MAG: hypothetical protein ABFR47_09165 [Verrucomicrobiota bacterium]
MKKRTLLKTLLAATLICASISFAEGGAAIKANPKSKTYHKAVCRHYNAKGSTKEFKSETEAQKAGYKACKQCGQAKTKKKAEKK